MYTKTVVIPFLGKVVNQAMNTTDYIDLSGNENCGSPTSQTEKSRENNSRLTTHSNIEMVRLFQKTCGK